MSEYTLTTEEVRDGFSFSPSFSTQRNREALFHRWLAEVKAEAWDEGWGEGCEYGWSGTGKPKIENPYREETE